VERYGLAVTVVSPGYIRTNLSLNAVTGDGSKYGGKGGREEGRVDGQEEGRSDQGLV